MRGQNWRDGYDAEQIAAEGRRQAAHVEAHAAFRDTRAAIEREHRRLYDLRLAEFDAAKLAHQENPSEENLDLVREASAAFDAIRRRMPDLNAARAALDAAIREADAGYYRELQVIGARHGVQNAAIVARG